MISRKLSSEKYAFYLLASLLASVSIFLHLWKLGVVPEGIHVDESSIAYNALSIAETARDEHGVLLPIFFRGFDNYHNPVMVYVLVPLMKFAGLEMWAVRLPSALFLLAASAAFYFLASFVSRNRYIALFSAFVFSLLPWIFPISRILVCGFTAMLFFLSLGFYFLFKSMCERSRPCALSAGIMLSLAMYSTHAGRPITALSLVIFVLSLNIALIKRWKIFAVFVSTYVVCLVPMIISVANSSSSMTNRFYGMREIGRAHV